MVLIKFIWSFRPLFKKNNFKCVFRKTNFSTTTRPLSESTTGEGGSYMHCIGKYPLLYKSMAEIIDQAAEKYPDREAIISCHENQTLTFKEVQEKTNKLAAGLLSIGLNKGDRIGIWGPNTIDWYLTFLATSKAGLISVLLNPSLQLNELVYCVKKVGMSSVVAAAETFKRQNYYQILSELCPEILKSEAAGGHPANSDLTSLKKVIIASENVLPGAFRLKDLSELASREDLGILKKIEKSIKPEDGYNIQFTSGTTGQPKASFLSNFNFVNNAFQISNRHQLYEKHHKVCMQVPFFHAYGTVIMICPALFSGTTLVLPDLSYNPVASLREIENHKCTYVNGTPTMYVDLVKTQKEHPRNLTSLEYAVSGGAPCSPQLFREMLDVLKVNAVKSVYGLTEVTAVVFQSVPGDDEYKSTKTVGYIQDHIETKVTDEHGQLVPFGTAGELHIRGYCNMIGYWGDENATSKTIDGNNWLHTGDQFILRKDGYGQIVGRLKDMIIRGGENIFPKEIEDFLNTHPDILENYVFGVHDQRLGEEIFVCMRIRESTTMTYKDLRAFCEGKISHYKIPRYMRIVKDFPKTVSGKVQKFKLQQQYNEELAPRN